MSELENKKEEIGKDGLTAEERKALEEENAVNSSAEPSEDLNSMTLGQLKEVAVGLGMDTEAANKFTGKAQIIATIQLVKQTMVRVPQGVPVADSEVEIDDPATKTRKVTKEDGTTVVKEAVRDNINEDRRNFETRKSKIKAFLDSQPKVQVFVPRDFGEKAGAILPVTINGYRYSILKGVMVNVPKGVYEVIKNSVEATDRVGAEFSQDRVKFDEQLGQNINVRDRL